MSRIPHKQRFSLLAIALLAFIAGGIAFSVPAVRNFFKPVEEKFFDPPVSAGQTAPLVSDISSPYAFADVAEATSPAVVYILAISKNQEQYASPNDMFFRYFFGDSYTTPQPENYGQGTGFIISEDGYILTNDHVVRGASEIQITVQGYDKPFIAKLVGADYDLDLAVLKIDAPDKLTSVPLGNSDKSRVGEWVIAIGNPWGADFDHTVTIGVLSAKGRQIQIADTEDYRKVRNYKDLMQTDAAINPGNSGGPLLNIRGEVIGINTAINSRGQGIGFAIPINTATKVVDQLIKHGKVIRPYLGIYYNTPSPDYIARLNLPDDKGILVFEIIRKSPADIAGLKPYDYIRSINGTRIESNKDLEGFLETAKVGDKLLLDVIRDGKYTSVTITLGEKPSN